jgi:hypothetical protein
LLLQIILILFHSGFYFFHHNHLKLVSNFCLQQQFLFLEVFGSESKGNRNPIENYQELESNYLV